MARPYGEMSEADERRVKEAHDFFLQQLAKGAIPSRQQSTRLFRSHETFKKHMTAKAFAELDWRVKLYDGCRAHKHYTIKQLDSPISKGSYVQFTISRAAKTLLQHAWNEEQKREAWRQVLRQQAALCIQKRWRGHRVRRQMADPSHRLCRLRLMRE
jgi:hypothetical protein